MTIRDEVEKERKKLEEAISALVRDFSEATGFQPTSCDFSYTSFNYVDGAKRVACVDTTVRVEL